MIDGDNVEISVTGTVATNAGTYNSVISAITGTDSVNYELPENATKEWNIEKAEILGIVFNGEEFTYDGNVKAINVSATTTQFGDEVIVVLRYSLIAIAGFGHSVFDTIHRIFNTLKHGLFFSG